MLDRMRAGELRPEVGSNSKAAIGRMFGSKYQNQFLTAIVGPLWRSSDGSRASRLEPEDAAIFSSTGTGSFCLELGYELMIPMSCKLDLWSSAETKKREEKY